MGGARIEKAPPDGACGLWLVLLALGRVPPEEFRGERRTILPLAGRAVGRVQELRKLMRELRAAAVDLLIDPANATIIASHIGVEEAKLFRGGKEDGTGQVGSWSGSGNGDRAFTAPPHLWALARHLRCDVCPCVSNPHPALPR